MPTTHARPPFDIATAPRCDRAVFMLWVDGELLNRDVTDQHIPQEHLR